MTTPETVLEFWFGAPDSPGYGDFREEWFRGGPDFDARCRTLEGAVEQALAGAFEAWRWRPHGSLALILLLDQLPRNLFRGTAKAFAGDPRARDLAAFAVDRGFDRALPVALRLFLYLPFEHSENLADQDRIAALSRSFGRPQSREAVLKHRDIILRFGRFPHRNAVLGRTSTPEEEAFAADPDNRFGQ